MDALHCCVSGPGFRHAHVSRLPLSLPGTGFVPLRIPSSVPARPAPLTGRKDGARPSTRRAVPGQRVRAHVQVALAKPPSKGSVGEPVKVVISGAGPSGLLLAHYLMSLGQGKFQVIMHDRDPDPREMLLQEFNNRRFAVGVSGRGQRAMSVVPGLLEHVASDSARIEGFAQWKEGQDKPTIIPNSSKNLLVDRVALCASMLSALEDMQGQKIKEGLLKINWQSTCSGADLASQKASFSSGKAEGSPGVSESYDLLVGADGVRSMVRQSMVQQMRNFETEQRAVPTFWTVANVPVPEGFPPAILHSIRVPRSGGLSALAIPFPSKEGVSLKMTLLRPITSQPTEWINCSTPQEAQEYWKARLPGFPIPAESAWQLRTCPVRTTMKVKCWQYHDSWGHAVIIGDAAHATSPALGQGCNSSLVDASVLARLLVGEVVSEDDRFVNGEEHSRQTQFWSKDPTPSDIREKLPSLLERFSALQVKEGHAVVDMSSDFAPSQSWLRALELSVSFARERLHNTIPQIVPPPLRRQLGSTTIPYSDIQRSFAWEASVFKFLDGIALQKWKEEQRSLQLQQNL